MTKAIIHEDVIRSTIAKARAETLHIGEDILKEAESRAPVKTGRLRQSGYVEQQGDKVVAGFSAPYAAYVEYGTSDTRAHPFLTPAALKRRDR